MLAENEHRWSPASAIRLALAQANALTAELARSMSPEPGDGWLTAAELQLARRSTRHTAPVIVVGAFAIAFSCAGWISLDVRIAWSSAVAAIAVILHFAALRLERRPMTTTEDIRNRATWQVGFTVIFLAAWCSMGVVLWTPGVVLDHMFIALILAASLAGSISLSAAHPATSLVVVFFHGAFLILPPALSPLPIDHTMAALSAVFVTMMAAQVVVLHAAHKKMFTLEHERTELVEGLRLAKQESDQERSRAAAAGRVKSQFLSNMNHELRTPMNAILGFSELIEQKAFGAAVDKYAEYAGIIHQSGQNLLGLIDELLDLSKIEGGKLALREREISLGQLAAEIFEEHETKAEEAGISLLKKVEYGLPSVLADERALRQIFVNLISNALKYTQTSGCVTLFAHLDEGGRIAFGVEDTGIGMSDEDQAQAFERFGGGRHDVTSADKGTGLGLAIVKGFAEAHDGEVRLESALGSGTRVTAYLPAARVCAPFLRKAG